MGKFWKLDKVNSGDEIVFLDTLVSYQHGIVRKIRGSIPVGESGNVLVELEDGSKIWILGSKIMASVEAAESQISYNLHQGVI